MYDKQSQAVSIARLGRGVIFSALVLAVLVASAFATATSHPSAHAATASSGTSSCGQWSIVPSPNPTAVAQLYGVASITTNDVWAVGNSLTNASPRYNQTLAEHWNGSQWSIVPTMNLGSSNNEFSGVAAVSTNDVWAVGGYTSGANMDRTLIERWNGSQWSVVSSPNVGQDSDFLKGITIVSTNDIWAVGVDYTQNGANSATLVEHWNGTQWSVVSSPNPGTTRNALNAVTVVAANNIWAVGEYINNVLSYTLIEHWNGTQWSVVSSPSPGTHSNELNGVIAIAATNIWAVGDTASKSGFNTHTLIEHWNGTAWYTVKSPSIAKHKTLLFGISAVSATNIWAVGFDSSVNPNFNAQTLVEQWNGTSWNIVSSPNVSGTSHNSFGAVSVVPGTSHAWAVGDITGGQTLTEFYC